MTLDEAIKRFENAARERALHVGEWNKEFSKKCKKKAKEYYQIAEWLKLLKIIQSTGDCNTCHNKNCGYAPEWGKLVRYNCPFYRAESEGE